MLNKMLKVNPVIKINANDLSSPVKRYFFSYWIKAKIDQDILFTRDTMDKPKI